MSPLYRFCAVLLLVAAQAWAEPGSAKVLFQVSTLDALSLGIYQGAASFPELKQHGNFGVGTFDGLDGEMVAVDGRFFQIRSDGTVPQVDDKATTPFAAVTDFDPNVRFQVNQAMSRESFLAFLDQVLATRNLFYAIKVHGRFSPLTTRSVARQQLPYPPLAEAIAQQQVFNFSDLAGTLVGFRCPPFVKGVNQVGYHFHFISDDERSGGHVLDFAIQEGTVEIEVLQQHFISLPLNPAFLAAPLPLP